MMDEIETFYETHKRPFVILSWGMSLDGKTVTSPSDSRQISSDIALRDCHEVRSQVDAILVGSKTAIQDDPMLTVRYTEAAPTKQPMRVVLSTSGIVPRHLKVLSPNSNAKTLIATVNSNPPQYDSSFVEVLCVDKNPQGKVNLFSLLCVLGERGVKSVLVEGGMTVHHSFFRENLVNKVLVYISPVIIGDMDKKMNLDYPTIKLLGRDLLITTR